MDRRQLRHPERFIEHVTGLTDPELAQCWSRTVWLGYFDEVTPQLLDAAFAALDHWAAKTTSVRDDRQGSGIEGAFATIRRTITPDTASNRTQQLAEYFSSVNINLAFAAVRQFEDLLAEYTKYVITQLLTVAEEKNNPHMPIAMSLSGMAFLVLFQFDLSYAANSALIQAREECIIGCQAWGSSRTPHTAKRYSDAAVKIRSHIGKAT